MTRCQWKGLRAPLLVSTFLTGGGHTYAQSFDCGKASSAVEHSICSHRVLGELDTALARELRDSMSVANPDQRRDFVWEERRWIAYRDRHCAPTSLGAGQSLSACLAAIYRERIAYLKSLGVDTSDCQRISDRYRALASAHPGESPLRVLVASPTSGVAVTKPVAQMANPATELPEWARKQVPPFAVPEELTKSLISMSGWTLEKLPNASFYALSSIEGTAHCYDSRYFIVSSGRAEVQLAPPGFDDEGGACDVARSFGQIDDVSVFLEEDYGWTPEMSSDITVATWNDGGFHAACRVTFSFAPRFSEQTLNPWEGDSESKKACTQGDCTQLRQAAFELAEAVQKDPAEARILWRAKLSAAQLAEYATEVRLATHDPGDNPPGSQQDQAKDIDPAGITQEDPLLLPYVRQGRVYLATLGHFTIGWRYFADWRVTFETLEDGKLTPQGEFAVGMMKGDLVRVSVSAVR